MKSSAVITLILMGICIAAFSVVLALGGVTVLYEASHDAFSSEHKDSGIVSVMTTEEAETILPLMADIISQNYNVVIELDAKDFEYSEKELRSFENLVNRLRTNNAKIKLGTTDVNGFRKSADNLNVVLGTLNADVLKMEELKQKIIDNAGDLNALISLYSEVQALSREITLSAETYAETADIMIEIAKGYDLDTSQLVWAIEKINQIADISIKDMNSVISSTQIGSAQQPSETAALQILFTLSGNRFAYGDILVIEGSSRLSGVHEICIDGQVKSTVDLSSPGAFSKRFRIERLSEGLHIVFIRCDGHVSKLDYFTVVTTPTNITISSAKVSGNTVNVVGYLYTSDKGLLISGADIDIYADGLGLIATDNTSNGAFSIPVELDNGEYLIHAEFSGRGFPLDESVSEPVTVKISSPLLFVVLALGVLGAFIFGVIRFLRKKKTQPIDEKVLSIPEIGVTRETPARKIAKAIRKIIKTPIKLEDTDPLRILYTETVAVIASFENIENTASKTPREIRRLVKSQAEEIKIFMSEYEYLHYANVSASGADMERMKELSKKILERYHENTK